MTAICKTIAVHGNHLGALLDYGEDADKTTLNEDNSLNILFKYGENESKTSFINPINGEKSMLVTGILCTPSKAKDDFEDVRVKYQNNYGFRNRGLGNNKKPVIAIHLIQSFKETGISPVVAHQIGIDMLKRKGFMGVVDTHLNKTHVHNHIIINAFNPDCESKNLLDKDFILSMRELSDCIQKEYGIPIEFAAPKEQLTQSVDSLHYGEWSALRKNKSWKSSLYQCMVKSHSMSSCKEDYIEYMNRFGYELADTKKNGDLLWYNLTKSRTILESTIYKNFNQGIQHKAITLDKYLTYADLRYSWDGRELTHIENALNQTFNTIAEVYNYLVKFKKDIDIKCYNFEFKLEQIKWANTTKDLYSINSSTDLNIKLNNVGTELSIIKKQLKELDVINDYYSNITELITFFMILQSTIPEKFKIPYFIPKYTDKEIAFNNALTNPLSFEQKRELYLLMIKNNNYRLTYGDKDYSCISTKDLFEIKKYFKYGGEIPTALMPATEHNFMVAYERQYEFLRKRFSFKAKATQVKSALTLLKKAGHDTSLIKDLTLADVINVENCYGPAPSLINDNGAKPSVTDINNLKAICKKINYSPPIEFSSLTDKQCRHLYLWACSKDQIPFCVRNNIDETKQLDLFTESINKLPQSDKDQLLIYRDSYIKLLKLGLDIDKLDVYLEQAKIIKDDFLSLQTSKDLLSSDYKNLIHLKQNLLFTQDKNYIFGSDEIEKSYLRSLKVDDNLGLKSKIYDFNRRKEHEKNIDYDF